MVTPLIVIGMTARSPLKPYLSLLLLLAGCAPSPSPGAQPSAGPGPARTEPVVTVRGRVVEDDSRQPISHAQVEVLDLTARLPVDSSGRFEVDVPPAGCLRLRVRAIGYGQTERTVDVSSARTITVGDIPLRGTPVLEQPLLLIMGCRSHPPTTFSMGIDTVLP